MLFEPKTIQLKDGRTAILRPARREDAQGLLDYLRNATRETEFLLRSGEESDAMSLEGEERWIDGCVNDPNCMMIVADVGGEIAGNAEIRFSGIAKTRHRSNIGIGLKQAYWGLGIGTALFRMLEAEARRRPETKLMELEFIEGNSRARALYEKMGFRIVAMRPDAFILRDGLAAEYIMQKRL